MFLNEAKPGELGLPGEPGLPEQSGRLERSGLPGRLERPGQPVRRGQTWTPALALLYWLLLLIPALAPPLVLGFLLRGTGPLWLPLLWSMVSLALASWHRVSGSGKTAGLLTIIWIAAGLLLLIVLLNVSRRSLAEVWFIMVRQGKARGFFSYFAALIYGFLTTLSALLFVCLGPIAGCTALTAVSLLTWAILYGKTLGFVGALFFFLLLFFVLNARRFSPAKPKQFLIMLLSVSFPFSAALLVTAPLVPLFDTSGTEISLPGIDMTPLVLNLAPSLPLLLDVPGYGFEVGSSRFSTRLDLSSVPLFEIEGTPGASLYLAAATYGNRTADGWAEDIYREESLLMSGEEPLGTGTQGLLRLRFVGDYYDRFPLPAEAESVYIRPVAQDFSLPQVILAGAACGLRFEQPIERGAEIEVRLRETTKTVTWSPEGIQSGDPARYRDPGPDPQGRIVQFARQWQTDKRDPEALRSAVQAVERHLKEQYGYSARVSGGPRSLALERFLFEEKRGYCLHFASALVVILRHLGIPARLVEGFRLTLDSQGRGLIRGTDAHAWAEAYIGGRWLRFDPTPAAGPSGGNPAVPEMYAAARGSSGPRIGFLPAESPGDESVHPSQHKNRLWIWYGFLVLVSGFVVAVSLLFLNLTRNRQRFLKRQLKRLVRVGKRQGISGPEVTGWLQWREAACHAGISEDPEKIAALVKEHITETFGRQSQRSSGS
ncbi:transglutaminase family protein [Gracilinema caldarium]|uniref:transglutaminase-like domain-containing protein n=1 Tax=Gracilinema caldarium TaxID=215591 RepID=UPI0026F04F04|nr:transglutaminase-like domain-containing protein [Gracilinema caldarium]